MKTFFSVILNVLLLLLGGVFALAIYAMLNLGVDFLGDDFQAKFVFSEISAWDHSICYDEYQNFDNYFVVKKKYDGNQEIVKKWLSYRDGRIVDEADTVSKIPGQTYYYIIGKNTNSIIGPLDYKDFVDSCSAREIRLF